jgi:UDP-N-acetylglucosamine 4,6-dehydratase/5-epimerase
MGILENKSILVTGGTGSFGRKFARHVLDNLQPKRLVVFSRDEFKQYQMSKEFDDPRIRFFLGDVRDKDRVYRALDNIDIVVHAAALKQIPAAEYNPFEFVKTNILGAQNLIDSCIDKGVSKVVALSSDKAANPINLYGATKLCSDKLFISGNSYATHGKTRFSVVRYGNVIGSRGSVIPLFLEMKKSGRISITDDRMTRFWITLDQGIELVMRAFSTMNGGEIFVPKIPSMKIIDLAKAIAPDCKIETIGIRPGEKLHEIMITKDDARRTLEFDDHFVIQPDFPWWEQGKTKGGRKLPDNYEYSSDKNDKWFTQDQIQEMINSLYDK